jgi:DNA repair exonuclease SbcCD nuclease subunit
LQQAYIAALRAIRQQNEFNPQLPTVLGAHIHVRGSQVASLFRLSEEEDVLVESQDLSSGFTYVALGHIHKAQTVAGHEHIRYTGSIERMDLGEAGDRKGVVLVEIGPEGLQGLPMFLPLESTPIYRVEVRRPQEELPGLTDQYPDAERALVYLALTYTAGVDSLEETLAELETIFPRWYAREWQETGALDSRINLGPAPPGKSFEDTVRDYLRSELVNYSVEEREELLARAEALLREKD